MHLSAGTAAASVPVEIHTLLRVVAQDFACDAPEKAWVRLQSGQRVSPVRNAARPLGGAITTITSPVSTHEFQCEGKSEHQSPSEAGPIHGEFPLLSATRMSLHQPHKTNMSTMVQARGCTLRTGYVCA